MKRLLIVMLAVMLCIVPAMALGADPIQKTQSVLVQPPRAYALVPGFVVVPVRRCAPQCAPVQKSPCQKAQCPKPNFKTPIRDCMWKHKQCRAQMLYKSRVKRYNRLGQLIGP